MEGYSSLRNDVEEFLRRNPEVITVTLKRPAPKIPRTYANAHAESYGRMPESCPILQEILNSYLPDDGTMQLIRDGAEINLPDFRLGLFQRIHDQVTIEFRRALDGALEEKHRLLKQMRTSMQEFSRALEDTAMQVPETVPPTTTRRGTRQEVYVEIGEELE